MEVEKRSYDGDSLDQMQHLFSSIEKRLSQNGRSCRNLDHELQKLQNFDVPEQLEWIKVKFIFKPYQ